MSRGFKGENDFFRNGLRSFLALTPCLFIPASSKSRQNFEKTLLFVFLHRFENSGPLQNQVTHTIGRRAASTKRGRGRIWLASQLPEQVWTDAQHSRPLLQLFFFWRPEQVLRDDKFFF